MKCPNCGKQNHGNSKYCEFCGSMQNNKEQNPIRIPKRKKIILLSIVLISLVFTASIAFFFISKTINEKAYQTAVTSANKYYEALNYKKAEIAYLKAIEIAPKERHAYNQLTDIYIQQNDYEKATKILNKAEHNMMDKKDIQEVTSKLNLAAYAQNTLLPLEGKVKEGASEYGYLDVADNRVIDSVHNQKGIVTSRLKDFDNDSKEELFVVSLTNDEVDSLGIKKNHLVFRMYEEADGKVQKSAEYTIQSSVMGGYDEEKDGVFLKEYDGVTYICATVYGSIYTVANGIAHNTVILTYKNEFQIYGSAEEAGSAPSTWITPENKKVAKEFAKLIQNIGLDKEAEFVQSACQRRFTFVDDVEMLLRIRSERVSNLPNYIGIDSAEEFGKIRIQLKIKDFHLKVDNKTMYQNILKQYHEYELRGFKMGDSTIILNERLEADTINFNDVLTLYYSYYDVNKDGVDELFIGRKLKNEIDVCDFWVYDGMSTVQPFEIFYFTFREHLYISKNNLLEHTSTYVGPSISNELVKIDRAGNIIRKSILSKDPLNEGTYKYTLNKEDISEERYEELLNGIEHIPYDWKELTEASYSK